MKFGVRKPNLKKSIKAKTTGKMKRKAKASINPLYGKKGMGMVKNPKRALYNKAYQRTTVSVNPLNSQSSRKVSSSSKLNSLQKESIGYKKTEQIEREVAVNNPVEQLFRKLMRKDSVSTKVITETVVTEEYTYQEMVDVKKETEACVSRFKQSIRQASKTVTTDVFFSNLSEAEQSLAQAAYYMRSYSFLIKENSNIIEVYHRFLDEKESLIKQFLHRHFQSSVESASQLKTERGRKNRLSADYSELTEHFSHLSEDMVDTVNTIWNNVIPENSLKDS